MSRLLARYPCRKLEFILESCRLPGQSAIKSYKQYSSQSPSRKSIVKPVLYVLGVTSVGTAGAVLYVRYDQNSKRWIQDNIPGGDAVVKIISQDVEIAPYKESSLTVVTNIKDKAVDGINYISLFGAKEKSDPPVTVKEIKNEQVPKKTVQTAASEKKQPAVNEKDHAKQKPDDRSKESIAPVTNVQKTDTAQSSKSNVDEQVQIKVNKLIKTVNAMEKQTLQAVSDQADKLKEYRKNVIALTDEISETDDELVLHEIRAKYKEKEKSAEKVNAVVKKTMKCIKKLEKFVEENSSILTDTKQEVLHKLIDEKTRKITDALEYVNSEGSNSLLAEQYWNSVIDARNKLAQSLGIIFPTLVIENISDLSDEEITLFGIYACKLIKLYQKKAEKAESVLLGEVNKLYDHLKNEEQSVAIKEAVKVEVELEKEKLIQDFKLKEFALKLEYEKKLREDLKRQAEVFDDYITEMSILKENELERDLQFLQELQEEELKSNYNRQLARIIGRMKGLDHALKDRVDADKKAQRSQILWNACQSLILATKSGKTTKPWDQHLKPLRDEVSAVLKAAAEGDELVGTVVKSIPTEAISRGVYSELALRDRFLNVEKVAFRVANIVGQSITVYSLLLSYLQSCFIFAKPIPHDELDNEPFDPSTLNNYDVLCRARYWLDRGDFEQTLRYMNLLKGAARAISDEWIRETKIFLETRQAADTLLSYAVFSSLLYLQNAK